MSNVLLRRLEALLLAYMYDVQDLAQSRNDAHTCTRNMRETRIESVGEESGDGGRLCHAFVKNDR